MSAGVRISESSVWRAWRHSAEERDLRLSLRVTGADPLALTPLVQDAADEGWAAVRDLGHENTFDPVLAMPSVGAVVLVFRLAHPREAFVAWLHTFTTTLEAQGIAGRLGTTTFDAGPLWRGGFGPPGRLALFTSVELADPEQTRIRDVIWNVDQHTTRTLADAATTWVDDAPGDRFLAVRTHASPIGNFTPLTASMPDLIDTGRHFSISKGTRDPGECREFTTAKQGFAGYAIALEPRNWQREVDLLRQALLHTAPHLDLAFIRHSLQSRMYGWHDLQIADPPFPYCSDHLKLQANPRLHARYTPDAHGIQVLTDQHLDQAHDLSSWTITALGRGRHLVEAHDLTPWYATPTPDPATLATARADFGDALLHDDTEPTPRTS